MDIHVGLGIEVLDLVGPWLQSSVFEDGCHGVAGRSSSRSQESTTVWGTRTGREVINSIIRVDDMCLQHFL